MGRDINYLDDRAVQANNADTYRKPLPVNYKISAIDFRIEITNGSTSGTQQIVDALTTIGVWDGQTPIFNVFPRTALAIHNLINNSRAPQVRDEGANAVQELFFRIHFGRQLWDEDYYLDCSRFANPEIRVPFAPTISATAFATGTVTITTRLYRFDDPLPAAPKGYLRWVEALQRTTAASGAPQFFLPMDKPLLGVMVLSRVAGTAIQTDWTRTRILDNVAGKEIFNLRTEDAMADNHEKFDLEAIERGLALRQDNGTIDTDCNFLQVLTLLPVITQTTSTDVLADGVKSFAGDRATLSMLKIADSAGTIGAAALDTTNRSLRWSAEGRGLPHAAYFAIAPWEDPSEQYPFSTGAKPVIEITDAGSGADMHLTTCQLG